MKWFSYWRRDPEAEAALTPYIVIDAARAVSSIVAARDAHTDSVYAPIVGHTFEYYIV